MTLIFSMKILINFLHLKILIYRISLYSKKEKINIEENVNIALDDIELITDNLNTYNDSFNNDNIHDATSYFDIQMINQ